MWNPPYPASTVGTWPSGRLSRRWMRNIVIGRRVHGLLDDDAGAVEPVRRREPDELARRAGARVRKVGRGRLGERLVRVGDGVSARVSLHRRHRPQAWQREVLLLHAVLRPDGDA